VRISTKLSIAFSVSALFLLAVGIAAIIVVGYLSATLNEAKAHNIPMKLVAETLHGLRVTPGKTADHLARLDDLDQWASSDFEHLRIDDARQKIVRAHSPSGAADQLEQLAAFYRADQERVDNKLLVIHQRVVMGLIVIIGDSVLLFVMLMFLVRRWLLNPVLEVEHRLARVAAGNFQAPAQPAPEVGEELTELSRSIDTITVALKDLDERANRAERLAVIGEACSHVSHSFRGMLNSIRTLAQYESGAEHADPNARAAFSFIIASANKLEAWVRDLMNTIRPLEPKLLTQQLEPIIRDCVSLLEPGFADKKIEVTCQPADNLPAVPLDRSLFEQAFAAVLNNAIDASPIGGRIVVRTERGANGGVCVCVEDEGAGMDEQSRQRAFDAFFTTKAHAVGLGLTVARHMIGLHRGSVEIESDPETGTRVSLNLPAE
jgi:signal transduction histidine kinase